MTRFARAKGSKASNEKVPEDGTPWEVMKEQLLKAKQLADDTSNREQAEKQRIENYENFLKEHKVQKRKATWCDFPEAEKVQKNGTGAIEITLAKKKKKIKNNKQELTTNTEKAEIASEKTKELNHLSNNEENIKLKQKNKQKLQTDCKQTHEQDQLSSSPNKIQVIKKNKKKCKQNKNSIDSENTLHGDGSSSKHQNSMEANDRKSTIYKTTNNDIKKKKKFDNGQPIRRKIVDDHSFQFIINGKEIELVRYDGFPIMKKDAERLQELKMNMMNKGIPKSEVQRTMKLERRRAEKALARLKREVCYNCRKGGHNLSDCPDLKSKIPGVDGADGMCFKCGSTEHRQFECKVQREKEFRFATCFICKEQGHIARQCPDNPKGMYPNGGCCKLCGDVTHLRKDCPTDKNKKEDSSVKLQTLDSSENIEDIGQKHSTVSETSKKPKKIKF